MLREMIVYSVHGWRHFLVCTYVLHFVCFGQETWNCMHFLVSLSLKTLWAGVKHWRTVLHRFYVYRKPTSSPGSRNLKVIQKCVFLKCICVWCLGNWSRILSGKPFNIVSMARLKTLQFRLTLSPLFTATHAFLISLSSFLFMICDWGMSLIDSPWFVKFSKMANFNFSESWFGYCFIFRDSWPETFSSMEKVLKCSWSVFFRRHSPLMPPS